MLSETFLLRGGKGAAAEGESSNRGESHGEELFRSCRATAEGNNEFQSRSQSRVLEKDGGMVGLEVVLAYRRLLGNEGVPSWKKTETGSQVTKDERWIAKMEEVPEQNTRRGASVNTKKESRRTCLTGSGTCPLSVRGLQSDPRLTGAGFE